MNVLSMVGYFLLLAVLAMSAENAVLARSMGVSRVISFVDSAADTLIFGILLTLVTVFSGIGAYFVNVLLADFAYITYVRPLAYVLVMGIVFFIVLFFVVKFAPSKHVAKAAEALPTACFNCAVLGTVLLCASEQLSLLETVAFSIGSSVGLTLAAIMIAEGQRKLRHRNMPAAFRGLPSTLLYIAVLSIAIYGLTGYALPS